MHEGSTALGAVSDLAALAETAKEAALSAGKILRSGDATMREAHWHNHHDVKIRADLEAEKAIVYHLSTHSSISILSEEAGRLVTSGQETGMTWIVDPLDGTLNYQRGIPFACVSIGLWLGIQPLLGVILDINRGILYWGVVGMGAWADGDKITVSKVADLREAVLYTGFPVGSDFATNALTDFVAKVGAYCKVRLLGSAALSLALVASGSGEAYEERGIMIWDVAAGIALAAAAGGTYRIEAVGDDGKCNVFVSNGSLQEPGEPA